MTLAQPVTHLLYLHGFRSSPRSTKAVMVAECVAKAHPPLHWWCPQLPPSPREAMEMVLHGVANWPRERMGVIGSSLGGFYATCVAQATGCRAVLLNPAVNPARDLAGHVGEHSAWHDPGQRFWFEPRFIDELRALEPGAITDPARYFAIIAKGDEVLDWREMTGRYPGARIELIEGGDHAISDFAERLPRVLGFLGLAAEPGMGQSPDVHPV
ncbi:YqiA/YcfP family alpha/beta fold hydrolase [Ramlibacter rhizophilus]|uniref:Esterase n=1 Tax=Ramlibacter rhizophilus TaxID=1781167 RepID=A0A4Z0BU86_9BURK|nr:YqiA/YcfP family alpha/beta fold hydrolase [Ramlibacter rhizophilus]TFZ01539.1 esterase [Ramlibacter rhizophilus]